MQTINQRLENAQLAQAQGNPALALQYYQEILAHYPDELSLQIVCGNLCVELRRFEEAAGYFRRIHTKQKNKDTLNALCYALQEFGNQSQENGQYALAAACYEEVLLYQPRNSVYWYNLGNAQREQGKAQEALSSYRKSIDINPNDADAYNNLGNVHRSLGQLDLAIASYEKALTLQPTLHHARVHLVHQKQHICDWDGLDQQINDIRCYLRDDPHAKIPPFAFLALPGTTAQEQKQCASQYAQQQYGSLLSKRAPLNFQYTKNKSKIKIGYLSADFRLHPLAYLITELIEQHNRDTFEIVAYSYGADDGTPERKRIERAFDHFVDIRKLNDIQAAQRINADQIDLLVDLTGYTQSSRTGIVALKPAPISINWLGYPGTMGEIAGSPLFDYLIADKTIALKSADFSEQLLYLPCYQPNNRRIASSPTPKAAHHLPTHGFVFCCFNQTFKITPDVFAIWMRLLDQVPESVLWLLDCNPWAKENLLKAATQANIQPSRLIFAPRVRQEAHLERQQHADLFLDTLPYNAHTTASDALGMNLPILTCMGETFPSRVSASLLQTLDLPELICETLSSYEQKALHFARHPEILLEIKQKLAQAKTNHFLFDAKTFARALEDQYTLAWQGYLAAK
jgi:protein O-GlcNAc transferase